MRSSKPVSATRWLLIAGFLLSLVACSSPAGNAPPDATAVFQSALLTATYALQPPTATFPPVLPTETPVPAPTATQTPDPNRTPPALPAMFVSDLLNPLDVPQTYIQDVCQYLKMRWDANNSVPGTVVMPIMFHSITDGEVTYADQISVTQFNQIMHDLKQQGFEAITMQQLVDFLERNARIPQRSVILIVDDRKRSAYFETHFKPYFDSWGWKVTNAWISAPDTTEDLWRENQAVEAAGYVDHQAHGVIHNVPIQEGSLEDYIRSEIFGAAEAIQQRFGKRPLAYIWPGGGFSKRAAEIAREAGYRLGFTINPRGPLMFNWIPLSGAADPARPSFMPETGVGDPLMVLPRYWDTDATLHIDTVRQISKAAAAYAKENKAIELEYYEIVCKPITGEIPTAAP